MLKLNRRQQHTVWKLSPFPLLVCTGELPWRRSENNEGACTEDSQIRQEYEEPLSHDCLGRCLAEHLARFHLMSACHFWKARNAMYSSLAETGIDVRFCLGTQEDPYAPTGAQSVVCCWPNIVCSWLEWCKGPYYQVLVKRTGKLLLCISCLQFKRKNMCNFIVRMPLPWSCLPAAKSGPGQEQRVVCRMQCPFASVAAVARANRSSIIV